MCVCVFSFSFVRSFVRTVVISFLLPNVVFHLIQCYGRMPHSTFTEFTYYHNSILRKQLSYLVFGSVLLLRTLRSPHSLMLFLLSSTSVVVVRKMLLFLFIARLVPVHAYGMWKNVRQYKPQREQYSILFYSADRNATSLICFNRTCEHLSTRSFSGVSFPMYVCSFLFIFPSVFSIPCSFPYLIYLH